MTAQPPSPVDEPASPEATAPPRRAEPSAGPEPLAPGAGAAPGRFGGPPRGPLLIGLAASMLIVLGGVGAGGVLVQDPVLTNSPLGFWRYGHGRDLAFALVYLGVGLLAWSWVRLGRDVLAHRVGGRAVLTTAAVWIAPMLVAPPLFTRDVFSYLAQGSLLLAGFDPYVDGPEVLSGVLADNVHSFWQDTPAPYGPGFILLAMGMAWLFDATGGNVIFGVVAMRLVLLPGLLLLVWALPELTRRLGGRVPVALWIAVANPVTVVHLVGGGHNDLLVVGFLAAGSLLALRRHHVAAIALVTTAMAVKASAGVALPFLVLVWAARMRGSRPARIAKATAAGLGVFGAVFGAWSLAAGVGLGWLPALSAPSMIVNWMSLPTGLGELAFNAANLVADVDKQPFINVARVIGAAALLWILVHQWWAAREGGPDAVRRAGVVLLAAAVLSPTTLPWYVTWGMALLAMAAWTPRGMAWVVFGSLWLMIAFFPDGEEALYQVPYLAAGVLLSALAAVSLLRPDPLRLRRGARSAPPAPEETRARQRVG